jgi:hypothetical protein
MKRIRHTPTVFLLKSLFVVVLLTGVAGCKKNDETLGPVQDFSSFNTFDKLRIGSGFRTTVRQGTTRQVLVAAPAADQANLKVDQTAGTLTIQIDNKSSQTSGTVEITMPTLAGVDFSGGVAATITGFQAATLPITMTGGSTLTPTGSAQALTLTLSGGSMYSGYDFPVSAATVNLSGGSEARVAASQTLSVTASGGSKLFYKGIPTLTQNLSGGSTITKE